MQLYAKKIAFHFTFSSLLVLGIGWPVHSASWNPLQIGLSHTGFLLHIFFKWLIDDVHVSSCSSHCLPALICFEYTMKPDSAEIMSIVCDGMGRVTLKTPHSAEWMRMTCWAGHLIENALFIRFHLRNTSPSVSAHTKRLQCESNSTHRSLCDNELKCRNSAQ